MTKAHLSIVYYAQLPVKNKIKEEDDQGILGEEIWRKKCGQTDRQQDTSTAGGRWRWQHKTELDDRDKWSGSTCGLSCRSIHSAPSCRRQAKVEWTQIILNRSQPGLPWSSCSSSSPVTRWRGQNPLCLLCRLSNSITMTCCGLVGRVANKAAKLRNKLAASSSTVYGEVTGKRLYNGFWALLLILLFYLVQVSDDNDNDNDNDDYRRCSACVCLV